jgi:hypothetical protein
LGGSPIFRQNRLEHQPEPRDWTAPLRKKALCRAIGIAPCRKGELELDRVRGEIHVRVHQMVVSWAMIHISYDIPNNWELWNQHVWKNGWVSTLWSATHLQNMFVWCFSPQNVRSLVKMML